MKIAISGTIGSGKSTVSKYLHDMGYVVFSCDDINYELQKIGNEGYYRIKNEFNDILKNDGEIDRYKLASIVFNDKKELKKLNDIMHPLIKDKLQKLMSTHSLVFVEVPLLFETDFYTLFDKNLLIITDEDIVLERLNKRGLSIVDAKKRIDNQMDVADKIKMADDVIYNNGSLKELELSINKWLERNGIC